ncbi:MAG: hypothetical protein K6F77_06025 [Lachnospiraceae bacterium]|nr:hypothetical protein [Lachnospiraceae bacterium]
MAGSMVHLNVAIELLKRFDVMCGGKIKDFGAFGGDDFKRDVSILDGDDSYAPVSEIEYKTLGKLFRIKNTRPILRTREQRINFVLANVSPDNIMSRPGYERSMKMHTHFRDGILDPEFRYRENLSVFHERLICFANDHLTGVTAGSDAERDFELYLGYVTHTMTDEMFMLSVRERVMAHAARLGLGETDEETIRFFTYDTDAVDYRLAREGKNKDAILEAMQEAVSKEMWLFKGEGKTPENMVLYDETEKSRIWMIDRYYKGNVDGMKAVVATDEMMERFINTASARIVNNICNFK